jgi:hypothetical protein
MMISAFIGVFLAFSILLLLVWVSVAVVTSALRGPRESFEQPMTVFRLSPPSSASLRLHVPGTDYPSPASLSGLSKFSDVGISVSVGSDVDDETSSAALTVTDTLRFHLHRTPERRIASALRDSDKHFCVFGNLSSISSKRKESDGLDFDDEVYNLRDLFDSGVNSRRDVRKLIVYCRDDADLQMLQVALLAEGEDAAADMTRHNPNIEIRLLTKENDDYDSVMVEAVKGTHPCVVASTFSADHRLWGLMDGTDCVWYAYDEGSRLERARVVFPFVINNVVDVPDALLKNARGRRKLYGVLSLHSIVYGDARADDTEPLLPLVCSSLVRGDLDRVIDVTAANNFLTIYFPFYRATLAAMSTVNEEIYRKRFANPDVTSAHLVVGRPRYSVLEQFAEASGDVDDKIIHDPLTVVINTNVRGFYGRSRGGHLSRLVVRAERVDGRIRPVSTEEGVVFMGSWYAARGVPIRVFDRLDLKGQNRSEENGTYYVVSVGENGIVLHDKLTLRLDPEFDRSTQKTSPNDLYRGTIIIGASLSRHPKFRSASFGDKVYLPDLGDGGTTGTVTGISGGFVSIVIDTYVSSLDDGKTHPLYLCFTNPSTQVREQCVEDGDVWDRPCFANEECPYYRANRNYYNHRGGCRDGFCEMPMGVRTVGFRHAKGVPLCRGCVDPFQAGGCCPDQESPDYVFEGDEFQRRDGGGRPKK